MFRPNKPNILYRRIRPQEFADPDTVPTLQPLGQSDIDDRVPIGRGLPPIEHVLGRTTSSRFISTSSSNEGLTNLVHWGGSQELPPGSRATILHIVTTDLNTMNLSDRLSILGTTNNGQVVSQPNLRNKDYSFRDIARARAFANESSETLVVGDIPAVNIRRATEVISVDFGRNNVYQPVTIELSRQELTTRGRRPSLPSIINRPYID